VTDASPSQTEPAEPEGGAAEAPKGGSGHGHKAAVPEPPRWSQDQPEPAPWFVGRPGAPQQQAGWGVAAPPQYQSPQQQPTGPARPTGPGPAGPAGPVDSTGSAGSTGSTGPVTDQRPGSQVPQQGTSGGSTGGGVDGGAGGPGGDTQGADGSTADRPAGDSGGSGDSGAAKPAGAAGPSSQPPAATPPGPTQPPQSPYGQPGPGPYGGPPPPPMPPWQDPSRYGPPQRQQGPGQQQNDPWQRQQQRQPRQPAGPPEPRGPLDLRTRWARGLALGAIFCTLAAIWYSISDFPTWLVGAGTGLVLGLVGLWLAVFSQRAAAAKGKRAPEAVGAIVWSSIASLMSLMIIAFSLIFYTQLSQLSNCMRTATTISAQNQCETTFQNQFGGKG
jgi:hypothetical protein